MNKLNLIVVGSLEVVLFVFFGGDKIHLLCKKDGVINTEDGDDGDGDDDDDDDDDDDGDDERRPHPPNSSKNVSK